MKESCRTQGRPPDRRKFQPAVGMYEFLKQLASPTLAAAWTTHSRTFALTMHFFSFFLCGSSYKWIRVIKKSRVFFVTFINLWKNLPLKLRESWASNGMKNLFQSQITNFVLLLKIREFNQFFVLRFFFNQFFNEVSNCIYVWISEKFLRFSVIS